MALDPDGCEFWMTNEYYAVNGLDYLTRIGSFRFPGCTTVGNGTVSGTVTAGGRPGRHGDGEAPRKPDDHDRYRRQILLHDPGRHVPVAVGERAWVRYAGSVADVTVPDGGTATRDFTLTAAATNGCFTDDTQNDFEAGTSTGWT